MNQELPFDASIPVLTEVLKDEALAAEPLPATVPAPARSAPPSASAPAAGAETAARLEAEATDSWGEAEWGLLEQRLSERILRQLQSRVDFVLEQRVKDSMAEALNHALQGLTNEIRAGLDDTIAKIVARAVAQELTHLQARKK